MSFASVATSDLLEQAHLAWMRGELPKARLLLETLLQAEPGNSAAQDLLANVALKQAADASRGRPAKVPMGSIWNREVVSSAALTNLVVGLLFLSSGMGKAILVLQAGLAHGFNSHTSVTMFGKYTNAPYAVPIFHALAQSAVLLLVGLGLLTWFYWTTLRRRK